MMRLLFGIDRECSIDDKVSNCQDVNKPGPKGRVLSQLGGIKEVKRVHRFSPAAGPNNGRSNRKRNFFEPHKHFYGCGSGL
jgi:hypothetical protein